MTLKTRIISRLDIKGPNLVKGVHLEGLRVLGKPEKFARYYYQAGADELFYQDTVASLYNRNHLGELVRRTAQEIGIPMCVGGGLRTLADIRAVLRAGADKIAVNTGAVRNPDFIRQSAEAFGSSTIVVAIEVIRQPDGTPFCFVDNGRESTGLNAIEWAQQVESLGAGEILLTSVDREGTGNGFDIPLVKQIADLVNIPVIAHGGAGTAVHVADVIKKGHADAVALASLLHYGVYAELASDSDDFNAEGNTQFMKRNATNKRIKPVHLADLKASLTSAGLPMRLPHAQT